MTLTPHKIALSLSVAFLLHLAPTPVTAEPSEARAFGCRSAACRELASDSAAVDLFAEALREIREKYVRDIDSKELVEAAIEGMIESLDSHSRYFEPDGLKDVQARMRGEYGGVGIRVAKENGQIKVIEPWQGMPAARAGIRSGDVITHIDGDSLQGVGLSEAIKRMRGPSGTQVAMTVRRDGVKDPLDVTITRETVKVRSVHYRAEGRIGYIQINHFDYQTQSGLEEAVNAIKRRVGPALIGYILDLRGNPGGLVSQAVSVSDSFLDEGRIVATRGRYSSKNRQYDATPGDLADGLPIVLLIDGNSASASEIVAAALQDHHRAILLGTRSYGKGTVQSTISLDDGSAIRITTARYYTPANRTINKEGISPDIVVADSAAASATEIGNGAADGLSRAAGAADPQLARAVELLCGTAMAESPEQGQPSEDTPTATPVRTSGETAAADHAPRPAGAPASGGACTESRPFVAAALPDDV